MTSDFERATQEGTDKLHFARVCVVRVTVGSAPPCTLKAAALQS
jgi:hypothetical protein